MKILLLSSSAISIAVPSVIGYVLFKRNGMHTITALQKSVFMGAISFVLILCITFIFTSFRASDGFIAFMMPSSVLIFFALFINENIEKGGITGSSIAAAEAEDIFRRAKKRQNVYEVVVLYIPLFLVVGFALFGAYRGSVWSGLVIGLIIALPVGFISHRVMVEFFPSRPLKEIRHQFIEASINEFLIKKGIQNSERIYSENQENAIIASNKENIAFLCAFSRRKNELEISELSYSGISNVSYEFKPDEIQKHYSNGNLYTSAGILLGGVAGALIGSVVGDLIDASKVIKVKLKFSIVFNHKHAEKHIFDVIDRTVEFSPKSEHILSENLEKLNEYMNEFTVFIRNNFPDRLHVAS